MTGDSPPGGGRISQRLNQLLPRCIVLSPNPAMYRVELKAADTVGQSEN